MTMLSLTTGTAFIMWLGEQITERGIGNGMSLIIFAGIVVGLPSAIDEIYSNVFVTGEWPLIQVLIILVMMVAVVGIHRTGRARRAPHPGAIRQARGRAADDGRPVDAPAAEGQCRRRHPGDLRQLAAGVPADAAAGGIWSRTARTSAACSARSAVASPLYYLLFTALIIFFCFFYVSIIFNPNEAADNMRKYGGFIPGIRPGKNTAEYMNKILTRITVVGGLYLAILSLMPQIMISGIKLQRLPWIGNWIDAYFPRWLLDGLGVNFYFGGTSLLIVVGVAMDTVNQIEAQLIMRHYEGFTPRAGRIRGRRSMRLIRTYIE